MAKRKKTKRRAPKKKTQRAEEPDEVEETDGSEVSGDDDAVDASFDDEEDEVAASSEVDEKPNLADRPVGPAMDPGSPDAQVSTAGGLWVMAVVFGLILAAVLVQFFLG